MGQGPEGRGEGSRGPSEWRIARDALWVARGISSVEQGNRARQREGGLIKI